MKHHSRKPSRGAKPRKPAKKTGYEMHALGKSQFVSRLQELQGKARGLLEDRKKLQELREKHGKNLETLEDYLQEVQKRLESAEKAGNEEKMADWRGERERVENAVMGVEQLIEGNKTLMTDLRKQGERVQGEIRQLFELRKRGLEASLQETRDPTQRQKLAALIKAFEERLARGKDT